jgi:hypothetical protein
MRMCPILHVMRVFELHWGLVALTSAFESVTEVGEGPYGR